MSTLKNGKAIIFDFDGTIVDSMEAFADIASEVIPKHYGTSKEEARKLYIKTSGLPFFQQLEQIFPDHPANATAAEEYENTKKKDYLDKPAFDDVLSAIEELKKHGIKTIVSSNNFQELVDTHVDKIGVQFDMVLGFKENFAKGEDHFAHIEDALKIRRDEMIFVGDSIKDGERAKTSGISFIGREGTFDASDFKREFPEVTTISTLSELKNIITGD
ncbi:MAG: HAD hydrolase-like protein [Deltaproteobacteria bacterium]|jgi:phosphoglycolate phosphatase|nr:HAD hydrolase-like protein [Deltaproteobacteria bacterium]